jgi:hypothetical protein
MRDAAKNRVSHWNWYPEVVKAGPIAKWYLESRTGEAHRVSSGELEKGCSHDSIRISDTEAKKEQASQLVLLRGFSPLRRDT